MSTNRFRSTVEKIMNNPESYTKEELHDLFLEMTERYLTELLSSMNYEKAIIDSLGEEKGNEVIEKVATSNPVINDVDCANGKEEEITPTNLRKLLKNENLLRLYLYLHLKFIINYI